MSDNLIVDTAERVFADHADAQTIVQSRSDAWKAPLWSALEEIGLTLTWLPEKFGGGGASLADGFEVIRASGRAGLAAPLAETLFAGWLLGSAGIESPKGIMSVAPAREADRLTIDSSGRLNGRASKVPFARDASHFAVLAASPSGEVVALIRASDASISRAENLAGGPAITDAGALVRRGAFFRAPFRDSNSSACLPTSRSRAAIRASYCSTRSAATASSSSAPASNR